MEKIRTCLGCCISIALVYVVVYIYNIDIDVMWKHAVLYMNSTDQVGTSHYKHVSSDKVGTSHYKHVSSEASFAKSSRINFSWIDEHPIYKRFYIRNVPKKKSVTVIIIVSSAPKRLDRRTAIRKTWWPQCVPTRQVIPECIFITDYQGPNDKYFDEVQTEVKMYSDIHTQLVEGGMSFGKRFIYHMVFATIRYDFDYFVRIDDDQLFCLERFLCELPVPAEKFFHWGWVHVTSAIRRPEESLILLSRDIVETFLLQSHDAMLCHPLADQMIATWLSRLNITNLLRHDKRIHHGDRPIHVNRTMMQLQDLCNIFIAIHGVYSDYMQLLWRRRGKSVCNMTGGNLKTNSIPYPIETAFKWDWFSNIWRYMPMLCLSNPKWNTSKLMSNTESSFPGREEGVGDKSN